MLPDRVKTYLAGLYLQRMEVGHTRSLIRPDVIACGAGSPRCRAEDHGPSQRGCAWRSSMLSCLTLLARVFWCSCCCARQQQIPGESTGFAKRQIAASTNSLWNPPSDWCFWSETKSPQTICVQDFPKPSSHVRHDPDALHLEAVPVDHHQDFCGKGSQLCIRRVCRQ